MQTILTCKKKAVFTCITANYDAPPAISLEYVEEGWEFLCFSDIPIRLTFPWVNRLIQMQPEGPAATNRFLKFCSHKYLEDYEWGIYLDGNMEFKCKPSSLLHFLASNTYCAIPAHPFNSTLDDELYSCILSQKIQLLEGVRHFIRTNSRAIRFTTPLTANRLIVRNYLDIKLNKCFEDLYTRYISGPCRDQLHSSICFDEHNIPISIIPNIEFNKIIKINHHKNISSLTNKIILKIRALILSFPLKLFFMIIKSKISPLSIVK